MHQASFLRTIYPHWAALHLETMTLVGQQFIVDVASTRRRAQCPNCQWRSSRVHSRFIRVVADLPVANFPVCVRLHGRRFRCLNAACPRQTFRERLPELALPYQRRTVELRHRLEAVGFALGGQAGCRLVAHLHLATTGTSRNSLLRLVRQIGIPGGETTVAPVRMLGIDDFAFRRGMRYGAILVDLEAHRVIDLLPNREAATLATWLEQHGAHTVEVVSRDRGGAFADGVRQAAPHAVQVADRFHLLQNLGQALDRLLTREHRVLVQVADTLSTASERGREQPADLQGATPVPPRRVEREHVAVEARRQARYQRVVALAAEGYSLREVARMVRVNRATVRNYVHAGQYRSYPKLARRRHNCDAFAAYLRERWDEGEHNSAALLAEIRLQGYTGAASTLRQYVRAWRTGPRRPGRRRRGEQGSNPPPACPRHFSPHQTRWILLRPCEDLDEGERAYRQVLCRASPVIATAQALVDDFGRIVRTRAPADLDGWLVAASRSRIPELVSFARGIHRDYAAVSAALVWPHSQGQVEGQVNRLKMLKRQTYGQANFDLLRSRVLYHVR